MILLDNCPEILYIYYACYYAGFVAVPVMGVTRQETIAEIVEETKPRILVTESKYSAKIDRFSDTLDIYLTDASVPSTRPPPFSVDGGGLHAQAPESSAEQTLSDPLHNRFNGNAQRGYAQCQDGPSFRKRVWSIPSIFSRGSRLICLSLSHVFNLFVAFSHVVRRGDVIH